MTDFERLGEEALARARRLLAKARGPEAGDDPDELDDLPRALDEEEEDQDEEGQVPAPEPEGPVVDEEDEEDEEDGEGEGQVVKGLDATPILAAIERRLRRLEAQERRLRALERQGRALVKALDAAFQGLQAMAKAQGQLLQTPRRPKAHAVVPTAPRPLVPSEVLAKALSVVRDPVRVGILEHYANRGDLEGMLAQLTPEERARILGGA